jgi:hypothetical protein
MPSKEMLTLVLGRNKSHMLVLNVVVRFSL